MSEPTVRVQHVKKDTVKIRLILFSVLAVALVLIFGNILNVSSFTCLSP